MRLVVPFDAIDPKTRLADVLAPAEREDLAEAMARDVLSAIDEADRAPVPELLATESVDLDVPVTVDERPLDPAVNEILTANEAEPVAVVMADLPLATSESIDRLLAADADVTLVPGRGGGTNAFVARHPDFRVDYHGVSYRDHREIADGIGAGVATVDSFRLSTDVDEPADLAEVLLHGQGRAADWLRDRGFELVVTDGRVTIERD